MISYIHAISMIMSGLMFFINREQKLMLLFIHLMCFSSIETPSYYNPIYYFLLSEILYFGRNISIMKRHKVLLLMLVILLCSVITFFHSYHLQGYRGVYLIFNNDFVYRYFFLIYVILAFDKNTSPNRLFKAIAIALGILTVFGILNLITRHAIFVDWYIKGSSNLIFEDAGRKYTDDARFRVQSMHYNPFNYGFFCSVIAILSMYFKKKNYIGNGLFVFALLCCYFGIITCRCRTVLIISILSHPLFYIMANKLTRSSIVTIIGLVLAVYLYESLPKIQESLGFITSVVDEKSDYGGSSLSMREEQFTTVMYHIKNDMLLGRGFLYFQEDLGWKYGASDDKNLYGIEGVHLSYLLERGILGFSLYLFFWISMIIFVLRQRKYDMASSALCLSVITAYLVFAFATGELASLPITLLVVGIGIVMLNRYKRQFIIMKANS